jgi:hypothetical protein
VRGGLVRRDAGALKIDLTHSFPKEIFSHGQRTRGAAGL